MTATADGSVRIFLSHNSRYAEIAKGLKSALLTLESAYPLDIHLSVDMEGATDWRAWIEETVRRADIFLLVYPHQAMQMAWCNYELGRYYDHDRRRTIVCIKNTDIDAPPPAFEPYQSYDASQAGVAKFLNELFVTGGLTGKRVLNAEMARPTTTAAAEAKIVAREVAACFATARMREHYYQRRLVIDVVHDVAHRVDLDRTTLQGNPEALHLLGLNAEAPTRWSTVQQVLGQNGLWLQELEELLPKVTEGVMPPTLSPFRSLTGVYIPVVAKAEVADGVLSRLVLIFVGANDDQLRPLLGWAFPKVMPEGLKALLRLVRMMFRSRWEILAPRAQEVRYGAVTPERCAEIVALILDEYDQMQRAAEADGSAGVDQFFMTFHKELRSDVKACGERWVSLMGELRSMPDPTRDWLAGTLDDLLDNNQRWLDVAGREFLYKVNDFS